MDGDRVDGDPPGWFAGHVMATLTGGALTMLISLGYRTGLFEAAAAGPARPGQRRVRDR